MEITADYERAVLVFDRLRTLLHERAFPYSRMRLPQEMVPREITKDPLALSRFFFFVCLHMRGPIKSSFAMQAHIGLWHSHPELYDPHEASHTAEETLNPLLAEAMLPRDKGKIARFWVENARRLHKRWGGDPRTIFETRCVPEELYTRIQNDGRGNGFIGMQKKMASMLAYYLESTGLLSPIPLPPPIDFHWMRMAFAHGILSVPPGKNIRYERASPLVREITARYMKETGAGLSEMSDIVWPFSEILCSRAPGNISKNRIRTANGTGVRGGEPLALGNWHDPVLVGRYQRTCGSCPVEATCALNVRNGPYNERGIFILEKREKPPLLFSSLPVLRKPDTGR